MHAYEPGTNTTQSNYVFTTISQDTPDFIVSGSPPPRNGGFGLFVFVGGSFDQLQTAACGSSTTDAYWVTDDAGQFISFVPDTTVSIVNNDWTLRFPDGTIPANTPIVGKCASRPSP